MGQVQKAVRPVIKHLDERPVHELKQLFVPVLRKAEPGNDAQMFPCVPTPNTFVRKHSVHF